VNIDKIVDIVCSLKNKYQTNNPFLLCEAMGITVIMQSMGKQQDSCKGFVTRSFGIDIITINSDLSDRFQIFVCGHELGHIMMNPKQKTLSYSDNSYFDTTSSDEKEANYFAAELILSDDEVMDAVNEELTYNKAAAILCVPADFLDLKLRIMCEKGYKLIPPMIALGDCFGEIEVRYDDDES